MKKALLAAIGAMAAMSGAARAEEWSGLYVGGSVGSASRETDWHDLDNDWGGGIQASDDESATAIGAHLGYNWQWGNWVAGAQGGVMYADLSETEFVNGDVDVDNSMSFSVDIRANAGYAFGDLLPYVTVGAAYADLEHSWLEINDTDDSWQDFGNEVALVYGAGVEYRFSPHWSAGAEYLVYDFGSKTSTNPDGYRMDVETDSDVVQFTLNYRLN